MPTPIAPPDQLDLMQKQIDLLARECERLTASFAWARRVRLMLALAIVVFVVLVCFAFYRLGNGLLQDEYHQKVVNIAQKRLEKNQDSYMKEVELLVDHTSPALSDAFSKQANKDMPAYMRILDQERDEVIKDMDAKLTVRLEKRYESRIDAYDAILRQEVPAAADPAKHDRIVDNLKLALDRVMERYYVSELERQMNLLYDTWDHFPAAEQPRPGDTPLEDQFMNELVHLLAIKLGSTQPAK